MKALLALLSLSLSLAIAAVPASVQAQSPGPLRIEITEGVIEPLPFAVPDFIAESSAAATARSAAGSEMRMPPAMLR